MFSTGVQTASLAGSAGAAAVNRTRADLPMVAAAEGGALSQHDPRAFRELAREAQRASWRGAPIDAGQTMYHPSGAGGLDELGAPALPVYARPAVRSMVQPQTTHAAHIGRPGGRDDGGGVQLERDRLARIVAAAVAATHGEAAVQHDGGEAANPFAPYEPSLRLGAVRGGLGGAQEPQAQRSRDAGRGDDAERAAREVPKLQRDTTPEAAQRNAAIRDVNAALARETMAALGAEGAGAVAQAFGQMRTQQADAQHLQALIAAARHEGAQGADDPGTLGRMLAAFGLLPRATDGDGAASRVGVRMSSAEVLKARVVGGVIVIGAALLAAALLSLAR